MVAPYVTYTHTRYMQVAAVRPGDTQAYTVGLRVGLEMLAVTASYQALSVTGGRSANYTNIGASLKF